MGGGDTKSYYSEDDVVLVYNGEEYDLTIMRNYVDALENSNKIPRYYFNDQASYLFAYDADNDKFFVSNLTNSGHRDVEFYAKTPPTGVNDTYQVVNMQRIAKENTNGLVRITDWEKAKTYPCEEIYPNEDKVYFVLDILRLNYLFKMWFAGTVDFSIWVAGKYDSDDGELFFTDTVEKTTSEEALVVGEDDEQEFTHYEYKSDKLTTYENIKLKRLFLTNNSFRFVRVVEILEDGSWDEFFYDASKGTIIHDKSDNDRADIKETIVIFVSFDRYLIPRNF